MTGSKTIRQKYLDFFSCSERGHAVIPSAPIVPQNDPTTLFTGSGMQPLLPYLLGKKHPKGARLVDSQKCFRAEDIEEVGDNRHTTFFEMLGNWSLGDYFKEEQLLWFFQFLTKEIELDPNRLYVTVYHGDQSLGVPRDEDSISIWKELFAKEGVDAEFAAIGTDAEGAQRGIKASERIFSYGNSNWWSRVGAPQNMPEGEPGGPDSEVFFDFQIEHDSAFGEHCHPNCDCGRFLEIGNSVFMEYLKTADGFEKLPQQNVDFGGGLERLVAAANDEPDVFKIDTLGSIIKTLERETGAAYKDNTQAFRVIADHMRAAVFMIADGVTPSNTEQGYFVRRLVRRSVMKTRALSKNPTEFFTLGALAHTIADIYKEHYPEIKQNENDIAAEITEEEKKFKKTIQKGLRILHKRFPPARDMGTDGTYGEISDISPVRIGNEVVSGYTPSVLNGKWFFDFYQTFGFPFELAVEELEKQGERILPFQKEQHKREFNAELLKHKETSRAGAEKRFKGGLADSGEKTTRLHTTHHLLLKALQGVLGEQVKQRGSNITAERLRIDFSHGEKMSDEQKRKVERIVNEKIEEGLPVIATEMPREEAEKLGAEQEFGQKYPDVVTIYSIGPKEATREDAQFENAFSLEFCGGPHVANTAEIAKSGVFKIKKEAASSAGVRRIKGVLE